MNTVIKKWGNSLGLRIPKSVLSHYNLKDGSEIEIFMEDDCLKLLPVSDKKYSLDDLVSKITDENTHEEFDFGISQGNEVW